MVLSHESDFRLDDRTAQIIREQKTSTENREDYLRDFLVRLPKMQLAITDAQRLVDLYQLI